MIKSKLLEIIRALDAGEMCRLDFFLRSPYFNQPELPEDERRLFEILHGCFPDFREADLQKEKVFAQLYPGKPFLKGKLDKKMSSLLRRVEQFMYQEELTRSNSPSGRLLQVARFYRQKELNRLYEISLSHLRKEQDRRQRKGQDVLLDEFLLQREIAEYQSLYNTRKKDINLVNTHRSLDEFYLAAKLEYACGLLSQRAFHNEIEVQDSLLFLEKIEPLLRDGVLSEAPIIKVYTQVFFILRKMQEEKEDPFEAYRELERLLTVYEDQLPLQPLKALQAFCRSFYTRQYNNGRLDLKEKIFALYRDHLNKGYLYYEGGITPSVYKNLVRIGLRVEEYDWVLRFLQEKKDLIVGTNYPQDVYHLNLATYYFHLKEYEKAMDYLVDTYDDLYYQIAAKRMEIQIYYEEKSVLLEPKIEAFRLFLRRLSKKKLPEHIRQANNNFINVLKQIVLPKTFKNPKRIHSLREKINGIQIIREKEWLLEKLE